MFTFAKSTTNFSIRCYSNSAAQVKIMWSLKCVVLDKVTMQQSDWITEATQTVVDKLLAAWPWSRCSREHLELTVKSSLPLAMSHHCPMSLSAASDGRCHHWMNARQTVAPVPGRVLPQVHYRALVCWHNWLQCEADNWLAGSTELPASTDHSWCHTAHMTENTRIPHSLFM